MVETDHYSILLVEPVAALQTAVVIAGAFAEVAAAYHK